MRKTLLSFSTLALLSACSYATDTAVQDITIHTPGAQGAVCLMYVDNVKYRVHPPQTTSIFRTKEDLIVDCMAPGNRRKKIVVEASYSDKAIGNVATAGVGLAWDYASGALFKYPDVVEVSFLNMDSGPAFIPAQNKADIKQPEEYRLEEFRPSQPRMNADSDQETLMLNKRGETGNIAPVIKGDAFTENPNTSMGKGDLQNVVESYGSALDPSASAGPTPLIPGE